MFELLPRDEQPKNTVLIPDADSMKKAKVLSVGFLVNTEFIKVGDIITIYNNDIVRVSGTESVGFTTDRNILFADGFPQVNKTHISPLNREELSTLDKASVIKSWDDKLKEGDIIYYKKGNGLILPDRTEIISDSQIFFKN